MVVERVTTNPGNGDGSANLAENLFGRGIFDRIRDMTLLANVGDHGFAKVRTIFLFFFFRDRKTKLFCPRIGAYPRRPRPSLMEWSFL